MPRVSVIIPAYNSEATIAACLRSIEQQTWRDFETIVVDSSPGERTARIVTEMFPDVLFIHSDVRLYPHAARNRGATAAISRLLVFTDSHMYAHPDWLARMVAAYDDHAQVVVGAIACYGTRVFDRGVHLSKFAKWLPVGARRAVDMSPTGNMLLSTEHFDSAGHFTRENFLGDVILSRALRGKGITLMFEPGAVVEHHHEQTLLSFLRERFERGFLFGEMRSGWLGSRLRIFFYLLITVTPLRFIRIAAIVARQADGILQYLIAMIGHAAWLAGEAVAYVRQLSSPEK